MQDWQFMQESGSNGSANMEAGPSTPPIGYGSATFVLDNPNDEWALLKAYESVRLDDITKLEYSTFVSNADPSVATISLQFNIDDDLTDSDNSWKGRLVFEPYYTECNT